MMMSAAVVALPRIEPLKLSLNDCGGEGSYAIRMEF